MRPTTRPSRQARNSSRVAVLEERVEAPVQEQAALDPQRGDPVLRGRVQAVRELDELAQLPPARHGPHVHGHRRRTLHARDLDRRLREGPRLTSASSSCAPRARPTSSPTSARSRARRSRSWRWRAPTRIMLGSNNYLGLTGDPRVIAARPRRARRLRHRPDRLAPAQRHDPAAPRARARDRRVDGHRGRDRLHHRPSGERRARSARSSRPGDTVIADSGDHASILDGCLLSRAKLRPFRHNRLDKLEKPLERAQGDGGGVLVVVDGVFSMEGDVAAAARDRRPVRALRRAPDGRRGPRRRRARRARRRARRELLGVEDRVDLRMGTFSKSLASCGGFVAGPPRSSSTCASSRAPSCSPPRRCRPPSARRWPRCASSAPTRARRCWPRVLDNAALLRDGLTPRARGRSSRPIRPTARRRHADRPGAGRRRLEGRAAVARALRRRRLRQHRACTPPCRPGGALLRTSVMATHDRADARPRAGRVRVGQGARSRPSTGRSRTRRGLRLDAIRSTARPNGPASRAERKCML